MTFVLSGLTLKILTADGTVYQHQVTDSGIKQTLRINGEMITGRVICSGGLTDATIPVVKQTPIQLRQTNWHLED
ncbi:MAG: hypothetical protein D6742_04560 [Cyanobacteria bacterium J069]|nr:MAG: hypothetical protein D6742_04560 [Cyanobacteria bacterium J069]